MFEELIKQLAEHQNKNLPFVVYRKPKTKIVNAILQKDDAIHYLRDFNATGFIFAPFDSKNEIVLTPVDHIISAEYPAEVSYKQAVIRDVSQDFQKKEHLQLIEKGISTIKTGNFEKVVLSRSLKVNCEQNPLTIFRRLLANYENAFVYFWHHPKVGTWLGATPEILVQLENKQLTTMSLAGTQKYEGNDQPHWQAKEINEQELVTSFVKNALKDKVDHLKVAERETIRAGQLLHLRTKLSGTLKDDQLDALLAALHPTPAVCGYPRDIAKDFILKNENYNREFYTGYLGELNIKNEIRRTFRRKNTENSVYKAVKTATQLFVNLRCMQWQEKAAVIYVGGGLTKDSDSEKEWLETVAKTKTMLQVLG